VLEILTVLDSKIYTVTLVNFCLHFVHNNISKCSKICSQCLTDDIVIINFRFRSWSRGYFRLVMFRNHTFPQATEFRAEPRNFSFTAEFPYFHRITRNLTYINRSAFCQPSQQAHMGVCAVINAYRRRCNVSKAAAVAWWLGCCALFGHHCCPSSSEASPAVLPAMPDSAWLTYCSNKHVLHDIVVDVREIKNFSKIRLHHRHCDLWLIVIRLTV